MRFTLFSALWLTVSVPAIAQILNVEKTRIKGDSANYFLGNIGVDFNINNRNLDDSGQASYFISIRATSDVGYLSKHHSFFLLSEFQYNATSQQSINSTGYGHFRSTFLRKRKLSYEGYAQIQYDQGRGMVFRGLVGGGLRLRLYEKERSNLYVGVGIMREREVWEVPNNEASEVASNTIGINIWKNSNYLTTYVSLNQNVSFNAITYFQTGYDPQSDFFRHRVSLDANLLIKISTRLAFRTTAGFTYENRPIVPIAKLVYSVTNGIQVSF